MASEPSPLAVYCAELTSEAYSQLRKLNSIDQGVLDIVRLDEERQKAWQDRLDYARGLIGFVESLKPSIDEAIVARNVVSRSYYVIHHALRAGLQASGRGDFRGHTDAIEEFGRLAKSTPFLRSRLGPIGNVREALTRAIELRHLADYDIYGIAEAAPGSVAEDFTAAANEVGDLAELILNAVSEYAKLREARTI